MGMSNEGDASTIGKKKHKKQKNSGISELGMDSNLQIADEDNPKKKTKSKILDNMSKDETVEDMDKCSKKKKKKDRSQIDVNADGDDYKREGKIKKGKNGDKRDPSNLSEVSVERINKEKNGVAKSGAGLVSDIGLLEGEDEHARGEGHRKKKKKYKTKPDGKKKPSNDVSDAAFVENNVPHEVNVKDRPLKNKKQDKVQEDFVEASSSRTLLGNNVEDGVGSDSNNEYLKPKKKMTRTEKHKTDEFAGASDIVGDASSNENPTDHKITEKVEPVEGRKQRKKKDKEVLDAAFSQKEPLDDSHVNAISEEDSGVRSSKRKETSFKSKKKGDATAGLSETKDINGSSSTNLVDTQINNGVIKEKKRKKNNTSGGCSLEELGKTTPVTSVGDSKESKDKGSKKRKEKSLSYNNEDVNVDMLENNEMNEATESSEDFKNNKSSKKVKFSENVEVFPLHKTSSEGKKKKLKDGSEEKHKGNDGLIRGKRFSIEEDEIVRGAVLKYIEDYQLGEQGVEMIMKSRFHPELKDCWKEIGECLPYRPHSAVYYRAHILFERSESRKWTPEEIELVKKFYEKHGPDWRTLSDELGKHRFHVKDAWRRIRLPNRKNGSWSQEEYQELFDLVNTDLSMKAVSDKKTKHGMLRDNISWEAVSEQLSTRSNSICCLKWYRQLTSPMVAEGIWANTDDYKLLIALSDLDASCEEDVDWDNLLEHRSGDICRKRWNQMVRYIGEYGTKSFSEQVDVLSQRYCPDILEARETYDNKTPVD